VIILKANRVNLFLSSVLFVFWYHSLNFLDTPHINSSSAVILRRMPLWWDWKRVTQNFVSYANRTVMSKVFNTQRKIGLYLN
jgi:hypothetical protein